MTTDVHCAATAEPSTTLTTGLHLHIDCASGAAGDMLLGACLDLGVSLEMVTNSITLLGISPRALVVKPCLRGGIAATDLTVDTSVPASEALRALMQGEDHGHRHDHDHGGSFGHHHSHGASQGQQSHSKVHRHYHYGAIRRHISDSELPSDVKQLSLAIFDRLATAEATLHGTTLDQVSLHEVGALDSIVDIVGTAAALSALAPRSVSCSAVAMGDGTLTCAHGVLPVPAPAALHIMTTAKALISGGGIARELCTPTGAAILATVVQRYGSMPTGVAMATGWGAGDAELADRPNVLRMTLLDTDPAVLALTTPDQMWQLEANIDDMNPQLCSFAATQMFQAGAVDVWWSSIMMKKGRAALCCHALMPLMHRDSVTAALFSNTTTIGVRFWQVQRTVMARQWVAVTTSYGDIRIKISRHHDIIMQAHPELDDVVAAATQHGVTVKIAMAAAQFAWQQRQAAEPL
jgi:pyridinium-3,5-bisthiocarboxylic acid mononucleotide nickel chelatase